MGPSTGGPLTCEPWSTPPSSGTSVSCRAHHPSATNQAFCTPKVLRAELGPSRPTQISFGLMIDLVRLELLAVSLKMLAVSLKILAVSLEVLTPRVVFSLGPFRCRRYEAHRTDRA